MSAKRNGFTMVELLIVIGIFACVVIMLLPVLQAAREASRRTACYTNMKNLGVAFQRYVAANNNKFPASSGVTRDAEDKITAVDGWSCIVRLLPYVDEQKTGSAHTANPAALYVTLDVDHGRPLVERTGVKGTPHADALATALPGLFCPSSGGSAYADPVTKKEAITNYKVMGATHLESLSVASPHPLTPKYGATLPRLWHPDGACFPGTDMRMADIGKGTSLTFLAVESIERQFSRWTVGAEAAVVGLPPNVEFERYEDGQFVPRGLSKAVANSPEADATYWTYHSYLDWDYDGNPYDGADGTKGGKYGASSNHSTVVNHLMADGSCQSLRREIDISVYMWLIKRR